MYRMSKKSLAIRIAVLPVYLVLWFFDGIAGALSYLAEKLWDFMDSLMDKFESWINRVAPLEDNEKV